MNEEIRALIEEQGKAFEEFKKANDLRLATIEANGSAPAELEGKVDTINDDITRISDEIKEFMTQANRPEAGAGVGILTPEQVEHKDLMFGAKGFMRSGNETGLDKIQNTLRKSSDPDSGYFLPEATTAAIERVANNTNALRGLASVAGCGGGGWQQPVVTSGASGGWTGETGSRTATTTPSSAKIKIEPGEEYALLPAYQQTLDDSAIDIEQWLIEETGFTFADLEGAAFATGDGVESPRGIAAYTFVANASYAWGSVGYIASGKAGAFADTNPANRLVDLIHALKTRYRINGALVMADATLATIRKFQDGNGNYLWQPSFQLGVPDMMLGKPVVTDDNIAAVASNSYSIAFADFKRAYQIVDRSGVTMLRDPYTTKGLVNFYMTRRVGGGMKNFEAIKFMKMAAS